MTEGSKWRNWLIVGLFILSLTQMAGLVFHLNWLRFFGAATAFAPAPSPFVNRSGKSGVKNVMRLEYRDPATGELKTLPIDRNVRSALPYPHRVVVAMVPPLYRATQLNPKIIESILKHFVCRGGLLARVAGLPVNIKEFSFIQGKEETGRIFRMEVQCFELP